MSVDASLTVEYLYKTYIQLKHPVLKSGAARIASCRFHFVATYAQDATLESPHEPVRLLRQAEGEDRVWQYACQVRKEALIHREHALGLDRPIETVESAGIEIAGLVVHPRHDGVGRMHEDANNNTGCCGGEKMECRAVGHIEPGL
jgi:hypothetical protein